MFKQFLVICTIFAILPFFGCQEKLPDGMPKLIRSASVSVTQDGKPLEDATVLLVGADGSIPWSVGGKTNAAGNANLVTHGQYPGAPEGKFKVVVNKREEPVSKYHTTAPGQTEEEFKALKAAEDLTAYELVDKKFGSAATTDAIVEFSEAKANATVDVGQAVRIKINESK